MTPRIKLSASILILVGSLAGAIFFSRPGHTAKPIEAAVPVVNLDSTHSAIQSLPLLREFNNTFIEIAKQVNPTVVTVFTEKVIKVPGFAGSPFIGSPFEGLFRGFFDRPFQQRSPREKEYHQQGLGSGVIVSKNGHIITNNHVVANADTIYVRMMDKHTVPAKIVGTDPQTDIAVIKVAAGDLPAIRLGDSDKLEVGEWVMAIGSPMSPNLAHTVTSGIVSAKGRSNMGLADYEDFIQTDAAINPGNSGGALINLYGELVGINSAIVTKSGGFQGIGFAVPVNMARQVMQSLIKHGTVIRGWLGIYIQDVNEEFAKAMNLPGTEGALVSDVSRDSPAEKAGLVAGDVILELNGKKIENSTQLRNQIAAIAPETEVKLKLRRDSREKTITVKLGKLEVDKIAPETEEQLERQLGFTVAPFTPKAAEKYRIDKTLNGVIITKVTPSGPAARAGLQEGDLVTGINRQEIDSIESFNSRVQNFKKGDPVFFRVIRQNRGFFAAFTL